MTILAEHVDMTVVDDGAVLLDRKNGVYLGLNEIGTRILHLLEEDREITAVVETLRGEYEVEAERLRQDVGAIIGELAQRGLLRERLRRVTDA